MEQREKPPIGATVEVTYEICRTGPTFGEEHTVTFDVERHTVNGFVGGAGIGNKVDLVSGSFFTPTSSDGYHADGDERVRVGLDVEWEVVEE